MANAYTKQASLWRLFNKRYGRALFYALTLTLGLMVAFAELDRGNTNNFLYLVILFIGVLIVELFTSWQFGKTIRKQKGLPQAAKQEMLSHTLHHLIIPIGMYLALAGFGYFNRQQHLRVFILAFAVFIFTILFTHIRALYRREAELFTQTNYIYDLAKILLFFAFADTLFNLSQQLSSGLTTSLITAIILSLMTFILGTLAVLRQHKIELIGTAIAGLLAIVLGSSLAIMMSLFSLNPLQLAFLATLGYYLSSAILYHLMKRDLSWALISEYVVVIILALLLLLGLT